MTESNELLGRENYFTFWLEEAQHHFEKLQLHSISPVHILSVFKNALGEEWLREQINKKTKTVPCSNIHEFAAWIKTPGPRQTLNVVEVSNYFNKLSNVPRFSDVLRMVNLENQFDTALLQLAFAFRFSLVGATNLEFEPDVDDGRQGDISFVWRGQTYIVECYVPENNKKIPYSHLIEFSCSSIMERARSLNKRIICFIDIKDTKKLTGSYHKEMEKNARQLIEQAEPGKNLRIDWEYYSIDIIDTTKMSKAEEFKIEQEVFEKSTCGVNETYVDKDKLKNIMRGKEYKTIHGSRFALRVPHKDPQILTTIEKLAKKIEKKVAQVRKTGAEAKGLILVGPHLGTRDGVPNQNDLRRIAEKVLLGHKNIVSVFLGNRTSDDMVRTVYSGTYLTANSSPDESELIKLLMQLEKEVNLFYE